MTAAPRYPRIPHVARAGDDQLGASVLAEFWDAPLVVEEKLDGSNVSIRFDASLGPVVAGRSRNSSDRAGQLGRLRAWAAARSACLAEHLAEDAVLYGEWLYLQHTIPYDGLPDYFVMLDLRLADGSFVDRRRREAFAAKLGLTLAPLVHEGRVHGVEHLQALVKRSAFGSVRAEGVVLRRESAGCVQAVAKWVRPDFEQKTDAEWAGEVHHNRLLSGASGV